MSSILGDVKEKPIGDADALEAIADEVESGAGPVALVRPGHRPVVLVSAEEWQRLDELESAESTACGCVTQPKGELLPARASTRARTGQVWTRTSSGGASPTCSAALAPRDRCWRALASRRPPTCTAPALPSPREDRHGCRRVHRRPAAGQPAPSRPPAPRRVR